MKPDRKQIVVVTLIVEGLLSFLFFLWRWWRDAPVLIDFRSFDIVQGLGYTLPLLLINALLFGPFADKWAKLDACRRFRDDIVVPLALELDFLSAVLIAALAGIGEELFFRGILQTEFGLVVASALFALLHFGTAIRSYLFIGSIYLVFGFYFGWIFDYSGRLAPVIIAHFSYDLIVLLFLKHKYKNSSLN